MVSGKSSATLSVEEIMTPESVLKTVTPEDTVLAAMELMIDNNFRHVPVVRSPFAGPHRRGHISSFDPEWPRLQRGPCPHSWRVSKHIMLVLVLEKLCQLHG